MGDTGSEGSKPPSNVNVIPPRCPCGFWGSSKTMNLCSKCFADIQKKQPDDDCAPKASSSSSGSQADVFCNETNSSISQSLMSMPNTSEDPSPGETGATSLPAQDEVSSTDTVFSSLSTPTKRSFESAGVNWTQRFTRITKGIDGAGEGDLAAELGLVLRDLLSADQHSAGPGKKSAGLMRNAELKFQPTSGTRCMLVLSQMLG